ncbi:mechanosensitive ion channel protein [Marinobacter sp. X15-166B]|nr:mechanosensitive ion channel protein [Marinobacter sp. X15-166B]
MALLLAWLTGPMVYVQAAMIVLAVIFAYGFAALVKRNATPLTEVPPSARWLPVRKTIQVIKQTLAPLLTILALGVAAQLSSLLVQQKWLILLAQSLAVIFLIYNIVTRFIQNPVVSMACKWLLMPILILYVFGWLDAVIGYLDSFAIHVGEIRISIFGMLRAAVFGALLFWLGHISNRAGQQVIRRQERIDIGTREVLAKLFQVALATALFILLLQIIGVNLTTLAVFGGALGVGLGFGLQAIAANFISGIIILLDRSFKVGDYLQLDDGQAGTIREINMRSTVLETFDGKDIVVPNEQFVTSRFINWTHNNDKQRYAIEFQVAYKTDVPRMLDLIKEVVRSHPQVLNAPDTPIEELADAEISGFGDSGINILVEFWMEGIDDGVNRVGADLLLMIWQALRDHDIDIPFPQREVKILNPTDGNPG